MVRHIMVLVVSAMVVGQVALRAIPAQEGAQQPEETTVVGCLQAGANTGEFVLVNDEKTTYQVHAAEGVEIAPHVNHRVELTGTIEKTESSTIFRAKVLKMVSTSCGA
jgi:hypothetical protein